MQLNKKISTSFFTEIEKNYLKIHMETLKSLESQKKKKSYLKI